MVDDEQPKPKAETDEEQTLKCGQCPCTNGQIWQGMTFCYFYNMEVYASSLMCLWGRTRAGSF